MKKRAQSLERIVVAFDIANDKRRRRTVVELEAFGLRVLESVFECWLDAATLRKLHQRLQRSMDLSEDLLAIYRLAPIDSHLAWQLGTGPGLTEAPKHWIV